MTFSFLQLWFPLSTRSYEVAGSVEVPGTRRSLWLNWRPCSGREGTGNRRKPKQSAGSLQQGAGQPARAELATSQPLGQTTAWTFLVVLTFLLHIEIAFHCPLTRWPVILVGWFHSLHESLHFLPGAFKVIPSLMPRKRKQTKPHIISVSTKIRMNN